MLLSNTDTAHPCRPVPQQRDISLLIKNMYIYSVCPQFFNCLSLRNSPFGSSVPGGSRARYTTVSAPIGAQQHVLIILFLFPLSFIQSTDKLDSEKVYIYESRRQISMIEHAMLDGMITISTCIMRLSCF